VESDPADPPRPTILVIEDHAEVRELVSDTVAAFGYEVRAAATAADALALLRAVRFDAILLDIGLPDAAGTSTLEWLRTLTPGVPVIVLTGIRDAGLARDMRQRGAFDYITKPFDIDELGRVLGAAIVKPGTSR
jgi:DNA-binding response OmpR family regulator